jgi:hypothetical protein
MTKRREPRYFTSARNFGVGSKALTAVGFGDPSGWSRAASLCESIDADEVFGCR